LYNVIINYIFISVGFNEYTFCKQPQTDGRQSYLQGFAKFWIFFFCKKLAKPHMKWKWNFNLQ